MQIITTARELMDKYLWDEACEELGMNRWAVNEGLRDPYEHITLTQEQAVRIGLIRPTL